MMSIRSLASSLETTCTLEPRMPTQAPTGSIRPSFVLTTILAREPGSLAAALISMTSSEISGTSILKSSTNISGEVRLRKSWGPRCSDLTSVSKALSRSLTLNVSRGIIWSRGSKASALLPKSTMMLSRVTFLTVPATSSPTRSLYSEITISRSASLTFCTITCLAVWAAIRPNSRLAIFSSHVSPIPNSLFLSAACSRVNCEPSSRYSSSSTTVQTRKVS